MTNATAEPPIIVFYEAPFFLSGLHRHILVSLLGTVPLVALPVQHLLHPELWPPHMGLVLLWLALAAIINWAGYSPILTTVLRHRRGDKAGLRIVEGETYLEVAFFSGPEVCRLERFGYDEITDCGCHMFFDYIGNRLHLPYVATKGVLRNAVKHPIFLSARQDARRVSFLDSYAIAADLDRIIRRHCSLPVREKSLADIADEKTFEVWQANEKFLENMQKEAKIRKFLGVDLVRLALALTMMVPLKLFYLDEMFGTPFLDLSDSLLIFIEFCFCYWVVSLPLGIWRDWPRKT